MRILTDWVRSIVLVILFANFIEMLLPNNHARRYVKVVMGFFIILVILNPLLSIIEFGSEEYNLFQIPKQSRPSFQSILNQGEELRREGDKRVRSGYKEALAKQIIALVRLNSNFEDVDVDISLDENNNIEKIALRASTKMIRQVSIDLKEEAEGEKEIEDRGLKDLIASLYGLSSDRVEIYLVK